MQTGMPGSVVTRRSALTSLAGVIATIANGGAIAQQPQLRKIRYGFAFNAITPVIINVIVAEYLGYFRQEGITVEPLPLGSLALVSAQLSAGRIEVGASSMEFALTQLAKGEKYNQVAFFETAYPFKWAIAVKPESDLRSLAQLRGKRMGVTAFGITDFEMGKALLRLEGIDPEKDVTWTAVGAGVLAGLALSRGNVDALIYFDTGFGQIEAQGIPLRYLDLPKSRPNVGGILFWTTPTLISSSRAEIVGFGRATAKAQAFILENPRAAAEIFLRAYPEAAPKGKSREEQIAATLVPIVKRMPLYKHYDPMVKDVGFISPAEISEEARFYGVDQKIGDQLTHLFTNELAPETSAFDVDKIVAEAKSFTM